MKITVKTSDKQLVADIKQGGSLLDALNKAGVHGFDAPCGGKGTCGKCRIEVAPDSLRLLSPPDDVEQKKLTASELDSGLRLACRVYPTADMTITIPGKGGSAVIQTGFSGLLRQRAAAESPAVAKTFLQLDPPSLDDQRPDLARLMDALRGAGISAEPDLKLIRKLPGLLRENEFGVTAVSLFGRLIGLEGGDTTALSMAIAVDIGTTTVVAYLVALSGPRRGEVIDHISALNQQKGRGGDVISRIEYCMQNEGNLDELSGKIRTQLAEMSSSLAERNGIEPGGVGLITIAGNTTMAHLFSGLDPEGIASAPFIPVHTGIYCGMADDFGLGCGENCACIILPGIAAYVGGDITSGIIASEMHESEELSLLIDIGTNGEIVLGNREWLKACSTAAGPALEGANISCGMGGVAGAVNSITVTEEGGHEVFQLTVIGEGEPEGVCGSGIVDALAVFLSAGLVDETGRILSETELVEAGIGRGWIECLSQSDGMPALRVADGILLTQKDVREIQMAKAAIAAGIKTLLSDSGLTAADVGKVLVAGGFGAAMNRKSAAIVGIFPAELEPVVEIAGNTAGKGAVLGALSDKILRKMSETAKQVEYIELSANAKFQTEYMMEMYFHG